MPYSFQLLDNSSKSRWDAFVAANPHAWPGHDAAVIEFERLRGARSLSHLVMDDSGQLAAVVPLFVAEDRRARLFRFRTLHTGSSLRGGPLLRADLPDATRRHFWPEWIGWLKGLARREGADEIAVSLPHFYGDRPKEALYEYFPLRDCGFGDAGGVTLIADLAAAPADIAEQFTRESRKNVRHALKSGATFESIKDRAVWLACDDLNRQTFEGEHFSPYSPASLEHIWDGFVARGLARVFGVRHEGNLVSVVVTAGTATSHYAWIGFNRRPMPLRGANNLLVHGVMERLRAEGVKYYEIGSLEFDDPRQQRIAAFKKSFGGIPRQAYGGILVLSEIKTAAAAFIGALAKGLKRRRPGDAGAHENQAP